MSEEYNNTQDNLWAVAVGYAFSSIGFSFLLLIITMMISGIFYKSIENTVAFILYASHLVAVLQLFIGLCVGASQLKKRRNFGLGLIIGALFGLTCCGCTFHYAYLTVNAQVWL